jgi:hypothetical protein
VDHRLGDRTPTDKTVAVPRRILLYDIVDAASGQSLSRHRTRQAAVDAWRQKFAGRAVKIFRLEGNTDKVLVVEGIWHTS